MFSLSRMSRLPLKGALQRPRVHSHPPVNTLPQIALPNGSHEPYRVSQVYISRFSARAELLNAKPPRKEPLNTRYNAEKARLENENPFNTPSVSLESLGIGKKMKMFLLAVLTVFGTIETWFWCKALIIWWKGDESDGTE